MRRYFEFALVVTLLAILATVLLLALDDVRRDMEEAGVQAEAAAIRAQLLERVAHREAFGGPLPASENPLDWVDSRPGNYVGELAGAPRDGGVWYFDKNDKTLVYRFHDGHSARFRLSREAGAAGGRGVIGGVGLLRLADKFE